MASNLHCERFFTLAVFATHGRPVCAGVRKAQGRVAHVVSCWPFAQRRLFSGAVGPGDQGKRTAASYLKRVCLLVTGAGDRIVPSSWVSRCEGFASFNAMAARNLRRARRVPLALLLAVMGGLALPTFVSCGGSA